MAGVLHGTRPPDALQGGRVTGGLTEYRSRRFRALTIRLVLIRRLLQRDAFLGRKVRASGRSRGAPAPLYLTPPLCGPGHVEIRTRILFDTPSGPVSTSP